MASYPSYKLTWDQYLQAAHVGLDRFMNNRRRDYQHTYGLRDEDAPMLRDIQGAVAELAFSLYTGLPWHRAIVDCPTRDDRGDVGDIYEVRSTSHRAGHLLVHPADRDDGIYVLAIAPVKVTGQPPTVHFLGGIYGSMAKQPEYWKETGEKIRPNSDAVVRDAAYWVPPEALDPALLDPWYMEFVA